MNEILPLSGKCLYLIQKIELQSISSNIMLQLAGSTPERGQNLRDLEAPLEAPTCLKLEAV